jgi:hypothetical protein
MFTVYGEKYLSRKAVHSWVEKRGKVFADDEEVEREVQKRLRQQSKYLCAAGFGALVKGWDKCINVGGGYVEKYVFFFQVRISHDLPFITICDLFTDSSSYLLEYTASCLRTQ